DRIDIPPGWRCDAEINDFGGLGRPGDTKVGCPAGYQDLARVVQDRRPVISAAKQGVSDVTPGAGAGCIEIAGEIIGTWGRAARGNKHPSIRCEKRPWVQGQSEYCSTKLAPRPFAPVGCDFGSTCIRVARILAAREYQDLAVGKGSSGRIPSRVLHRRSDAPGGCAPVENIECGYPWAAGALIASADNQQ